MIFSILSFFRTRPKKPEVTGKPELTDNLQTQVISDPGVGAYKLWTLDATGGPVSTDDGKYPNPTKSDAVDIYFAVLENDRVQVPKAQLDLQVAVSKALHTIQCLYLQSPQTQNNKFRIYYVRLFSLAKLGLEGPYVNTAVANSALNDVVADLINDEAGIIKNRHLQQLGGVVLKFSFVLLIAYFALCLTPKFSNDNISNFWTLIHVDPTIFANFLLLWIGCFIGVWLSYGIRTTTITLNDLIITDADRLSPTIRLIFAGIFTMILGLFFISEIVTVKIGGYGITEISTNPILAFIVGVFCGITELSLPDSVGKRASAFIATLK